MWLGATVTLGYCIEFSVLILLRFSIPDNHCKRIYRTQKFAREGRKATDTILLGGTIVAQTVVVVVVVLSFLFACLF